MSPASRAEPVGTREDIRLEDRLQQQLQGCLDHPSAIVAIPNRRSLPPPCPAVDAAVRLSTPYACPSRQWRQPCCPAPDATPPTGTRERDEDQYRGLKAPPLPRHEPRRGWNDVTA